MSFPSKKELERVKKKLKTVEPTRVLSSSASVADQLKFALCKEFVVCSKSSLFSWKYLGSIFQIPILPYFFSVTASISVLLECHMAKMLIPTVVHLYDYY